jgi:hypothetical protein
VVSGSGYAVMLDATLIASSPCGRLPVVRARHVVSDWCCCIGKATEHVILIDVGDSPPELTTHRRHLTYNTPVGFHS